MSGISHRFVKTNGINMHFAEAGAGPIVLLLHGFPEFWFSWRYQIPALADAGFHPVAPDMRGFGQTDAPIEADKYTVFDIIGDLIGLINELGAKKPPAYTTKQVFVVGHDWGAEAAWALALLRPDRVSAVVALSVPYTPRQNKGSVLSIVGSRLGDGWYMCQFQKPGYAEAEITRVGLPTFLREQILSSKTSPLVVPEGKRLGDIFEGSTPLTSWFTAEDLDQYVQAFNKSGLTGPINVYRAIQRTWELKAPYTELKITTPAFFIAGSRDVVWHVPGTRQYVEGGGLKHFVPNLSSSLVLESGHFMHQEKYDEVNEFLVDFLKKTSHRLSRL